MTLRTGSPGPARGFTLIEVMVTVAVLSFGLAMLYRAFFSSLDALGYVSERLCVNLEMNNRIWALEDAFNRAFDESDSLTDSGKTKINNVTFSWKSSDTPLDGTINLHKLEVRFLWPERNKNLSLTRVAYVGR